MLGYGIDCEDCSRFIAISPMTPPSTPTRDFAFSFNYTPSLGTTLPAVETLFRPDDFTITIEEPHWNWPKFETTRLEEPSTKTSRFNWSEMEFSTEQHAFDSYDSSIIDSDNTHSSASDTEPSFHSNCAVCSMVPYGAFCTTCAQIQTSRAITLATPPAAAWPIVDRLGDWTGTKALEEELLRNLDMELFEEINVPHELDEWGRRVWNDCGHRILYYQDADGNTVTGYEADYPSSVIGDYEEPDDVRTGRQIQDSAVDDEVQCPEYDGYGRRILYTADWDGKLIFDGYEAMYSSSVISQDEDAEDGCDITEDDMSMLDFEQQRFAEFLTAQDEEMGQFQSDRERIAAWIATAFVADDDALSDVHCETKEMQSQVYTDFDDDMMSVLDGETKEMESQGYTDFDDDKMSVLDSETKGEGVTTVY